MDAAPKKYNTVYKITNNANEQKKTYVGVHATDDLDDDYMGSGKALNHAKDKYGKDKFTKEILSIHETYEEALAEEARIVDEDFVKRKDNYNIQTGGMGGSHGRHVSKKTRAKMSATRLGKPRAPHTDAAKAKIGAASKGRTHTEESKAKIAAAGTGRTHTEESKAKMSASQKGNTNALGITQSAEHRAKRSAAMKGKQNALGQTRSKESRARMSVAQKGIRPSEESKARMSVARRNRPKKTCPHCGAIMDPCHYVRWHGDKCKMKPQ